MKRMLLVCGVAILVASLVIGGCAKPTPAEPIKLLWATFTPPGDASTETMQAYADELTQRSDGRVEIELSLGGALAPAPELYGQLVAGACDMVFFMPNMTPGVFPYTEVVGLPCFLPKADVSTKALNTIMKKGYYDTEWDKVKLLYAFTGSGAIIYWRDKPITTIADFADKKIRVFSDTQASAMSALGAVPVFMPVGECYGALEKGTVDGMWGGYFACIPYKFYEVAKYCTEMLMFAGPLCSAMNLDSYNKLPKDIQAIIDEMSYPNETWAIDAAKRQDAAEAEGIKKFTEYGRIDQLAPGELSKMEQLLAPIWTDWIDYMEGKGLKPKEMLAEFYSTFEAAGVEKPFVGYTPSP